MIGLCFISVNLISRFDLYTRIMINRVKKSIFRSSYALARSKTLIHSKIFKHFLNLNLIQFI
jgi:hypothetical protein